MPYLLVTAAANWSRHSECVTSLPSWSCGFDSRRPLQFINNSRSFVRLLPFQAADAERPELTAGPIRSAQAAAR